MSEESSALYTFNAKFAAEVKRDYGFNLYGTGGSVPEKIEEVMISFKSNYPEDIQGARKLAIPIAFKLVQRLNEDTNIRPYLASYPASLKNISLTLGFKEESKGSLNSVMVIGRRNLVVYNVYNENRDRLVELHEETFDEALKILESEGH